MARWPVAVAAVIAVGTAAIAHALPTSIVDGATASRPAERLTPPGPHLGGCPVFPSGNAWNQSIASAPLHPLSAQIIDRIQSVGGKFVHPDVGTTFGIPFVVVPASQPLVPIRYDAYGDESDPGPFPIPLDAPIEGGGGGGDSHVLALQQGTCQLYELFVGRREGSGWVAASGAKFDLLTGALRPIGWTSADAAGLPILPGLVRYDEVASGVVQHAIRVTFSQTRRGFVLPATHFASSNSDPSLPAMGMRMRLRAEFDISGLTGQARIIATAMQQFGLIVADNGSNWFFQGAPDPGWNDTDLDQLKSIPGTAFEVVDTGPVRTQ
ncbi:MAG: hypothetical protein ABIZ69_05470 [Ilumatobacteraceae bacterium]